jgi:pimeloyl-ACP methyl ester carboxylesterase/DNA-binding winged helix-turn-helix (wHTH) protein
LSTSNSSLSDQVAISVPEDLIYSFGEYELDTRLHELRRGSERVHVEPQVFDVLAHLISRRDRVVTKDELLDQVWGHRYVAPTTLNSRIKAARQAVDDDGTDQRVIRTIHGRGFRFVDDVTERSAIASPVARRDEQLIRFCTASDGVRIAYATSGAGPPLVKPANWMTHLEYDWESPVWRHWLRALSSDNTLVRYDERGNGLSDREVDDLSFDAWVRDLESVVDAAGLERFPLFGISQGCAVAVTYAVRHPERVTRLVLYGGYVQGMMPRARTQRERDEVKVVMQNIPLGWGHDNPAFRLFFAARFLPEGTPEQMRWFSELQRITTSPETGSRLLSTAATIDVTDLLPLVKVPALVLHATNDAVAPFNEGRKFAMLIPDARFVPLESKNHILLESEPAWGRFVEELRKFLAEDANDARSTDNKVDDAPLTREKPATPRRSSPRSRRRSG